VLKLDCDLFFLHYKKLNGKGQIVWQSDYSDINGEIFFNLNCFYNTKGEENILSDPDRTWAVVFKREILHDFEITYPPDVPFLEDSIFLAKYFALTRSYSFVNLPFYCRTIRIGSATNSNLIYSMKAMKGFSFGVKNLNDFIEFNSKKVIFSDRLILLNQTLVKFVSLPLIASLNSKSPKKIFYSIKLFKSQKIRLDYKQIRYPYNVIGFLLNHSVFGFIMFQYLSSRFFILRQKLLSFFLS
jgi:hypothetical protein